MSLIDPPRAECELLIVDDDLSTRMLLRSVLGKQGYRVVEAGDGAAALDAFRNRRPALVLLDVMMPVMDGYTACREMRQLDPESGVPILMLTGADDMSAIEQAFDSGATDFITKPINWPLLTQRVRYALRASDMTRELRHNRMRQKSARHLTRVGYWQWHTASDRLEWSEDMHEQLHLSPQSMAHLDALLERVHVDDRLRLRQALNVARRAHAPLDVEFRLRDDHGEERILRLACEPPEPDERPHENLILLGAYQDVTGIRRTEMLVDYLSLHDNLTGLPNRRFFLRQLDTAIDTAKNKGGQLSVALLDIARLARINDALGTAAGDLLIGLIAQRLKEKLPADANVARIGGDEFAVLLTDQPPEQATHQARHLLENFNQPVRIEDREVFVNISVGIAGFPEHALDGESLLQSAQEAQHHARELGNHGIAVQSARLGRAAEEALALEHALRLAMDRHHEQFHLVYQPQLDLRTDRIVGVEALIRWQHPEQGLIPPPVFIPILEEIGLIGALGQWILEEACRQAREWSERKLRLRVGVNLSPRQFVDGQLATQIHDTAQRIGVDPGLIELEITESLAMHDPDTTLTLLAALRQKGFKIAIDDFGIGYSSLEYLLRFPIDTIKIDRAFVMHITDTPRDRAIVRAITAIAQSLGLTTIAEGVETLRQRDFVDALGVTEIQGYLLGKPMRAEELERFAREFRGSVLE